MSEREGRLITALPEAEYHGMERLSSGGCKQLLRSPLHYRTWRLTPHVATPAMQFGSVVHTMVLEPTRLNERMIVLPEDAPDRRSNAGKDWHVQFQQRAAGKIILSAEDAARAHSTAQAVLASHGFSLLTPGGYTETSLLWRHPTTDVLCKARPDWFHDSGVCFDLKTTLDASRESFMRQLWNLRYDLQAMFYLESILQTTGILPHSFVWGAVETSEPFGVAWYRMGHAELEIARADIENAIHLYAECSRFNTWTRGYPTEVQEIRLPPWARSRQAIAALQEF